MKKIVLGLILALTAQSHAQSTLPYKQRAKASQNIAYDYDDERDYSAEEEKLIEQIKAAKEKLKSYKISQSTNELMGDLFISTALGGAMGAVGGAVEGYLKFNISDGDNPHIILNSLIQFSSGAINGFCLSFAANSGLYPKMSLSQLALILFAHNVLLTVISTWLSNLSENEKAIIENNPTIMNIIGGILIIQAKIMNINAYSYLAIIPEIMAILYFREAANKNKVLDEELLAKLEKALKRAELKALREELQA